MASVQQRRNHTLQYFDQYDYPLTAQELECWLHTTESMVPIEHHGGYFFLKGKKTNITLRTARAKNSQKKWQIAHEFAQRLQYISTVEAIFVTGALSMNNCPVDDDIDIMIVSRPNTLWLTRFRVYLALNGHRRPTSVPEHASSRVSNKICDNLYLDASHLMIQRQDLYTAHEILQAKCIFDRSNIAHRFITCNSWVESFLPVAFKKSHVVSNLNSQKYSTNLLLGLGNFIAFIVQYVYMFPKITTERISLHAAFFHPRKYTNAKN